MTKSEMQWENNLDTERASSIARRFAIEDLALKYRTSLKMAEKLLASGTVVERQSRVSPKSPEVIEIDDSPREIKVAVTDEDMDVDVEGFQSSQGLSRESSLKQEPHFQQARSPPFDRARASPRSGQVFVFSSRNKSNNHVSPFQRQSYPTSRFASQTWPYCVTYPYLTRNGTFAGRYPLPYNVAGMKGLPRHLPIELLRNRYRLVTGQRVSQGERHRGFGTPEERSHVPTSTEQRPRMFASSDERPRMFVPMPEERPQPYAPSEERPRTFSPSDERPRVWTLEEKKERVLNEKTYRVFTSEGENSRLYEQRPRSYTPPDARVDSTTTGYLNSTTLKPRRHSDDAVTNYTRPSVLVMQRSLSNPSTALEVHKHESNCEQCACADDHQLTDSDSSATPPLAQEGESSSSDTNKGKISGTFDYQRIAARVSVCNWDETS